MTHDFSGSAGGMTQMMFTQATSGMTLRQAVAQLHRDAHIRTVRESLARFVDTPAGDVKALQSAIVRALMATDPGAKQEAMERKVRMWMKDDVQTINRAGAIQLAFALHLDEERAQELLMLVTGEKLHWRDPSELTMGWALMQGYDYPKAKALLEDMRQEKLLELPAKPDKETYTLQVYDELTRVTDEDELAAFLSEYKGRLSALHNTAYGVFMEFLANLGVHQRVPKSEQEKKEEKEKRKQQKKNGEPIDRRMTMQGVLETFMHEKFIPRIHRAEDRKLQGELVLSAMQREIRQNWPDASSLSRMEKRDTDVTRKTLILLFLATDGGDSLYADWSNEHPEDAFEDMYARLDLMLDDCGFAKLDSRSPFDWMVLYCMCASEASFVDEQVQRFLRGIFPERPPEPEG